MELGQLVERLSAKVDIHNSESAAFAQEVERGCDIFESEAARKYHDGCSDTLRETLELLSMLYIPSDSEVSDSVHDNSDLKRPGGPTTVRLVQRAQDDQPSADNDNLTNFI